MAVQTKSRIWMWLLGLAAVFAALAANYLLTPWGFYWKVDAEEAALRMSLVERAEAYLGVNEGDGSYHLILDRYNGQPSLPMDYALTETDSWCAAFVSVAAMDAGLTDIVPVECGCERQISLLQNLSSWEERDSAIPLPGDLIYYDWNNRRPGDCTGWADHVGIVVGTKWPFVKVIEGNRDDQVCYRYLLLNDISIRGFGMPDYASLVP